MGGGINSAPKIRHIPHDDPVNSLDIAILQNNLLTPVLGIGDPRSDERIDFVGGIRGLKELEKRVDSGEWAVAFALYPTSISQLFAVADAGLVMPPEVNLVRTETPFRPHRPSVSKSEDEEG